MPLHVSTSRSRDVYVKDWPALPICNVFHCFCKEDVFMFLATCPFCPSHGSPEARMCSYLPDFPAFLMAHLTHACAPTCLTFLPFSWLT
eukprot:1148880-Pelagomonas_calceolata.AAC.5